MDTKKLAIAGALFVGAIIAIIMLKRGKTSVISQYSDVAPMTNPLAYNYQPTIPTMSASFGNANAASSRARAVASGR